MNLPATQNSQYLSDNYTPHIEAFLVNFCQGKIEESRPIGAGYTALWQEIDAYLRGGGKRLRPRIFLMAHQFYGDGTPPPLEVACAWELLHASLLIHDDIIDRDTVRHGKLNIAGTYQRTYADLTDRDADHYALSAALLAGDLLLSSAYEVVSQSDLTDSQKVTLYSYLHKAIFAVGGGELIDTESALHPVNTVDPYAIATHKTASYSFVLPMTAGAALAGASPEELSKLSDIGRFTGIAFQLKDDLLGVFGDSQATGKSNRSDLIEKKRTLLIQHALTSATPDDAARLRELYASRDALTEAEAEEAYDIISGTTAKNEIEALVAKNSESALALVETLAITEEDRRRLAGLIISLIGRRA